MIRRSFLAIPCLLFARTSLAVQSQILIYRNSQIPLIGTASGAAWEWPGAALSANTYRLSPDSPVKSARWVLIWNPCVSDKGSPTGVRIVSCADGPTDICAISAFAHRDICDGPLVNAADITAEINLILLGHTYRHIGNQTFGNGMNGCKIYGSWIELQW